MRERKTTMKKILFIGGYNSKGMKADTLENKGTKVFRLLPDYDIGLFQWIEQAEKLLGEHRINEVHASSTGAQVACKLKVDKLVLYSPVIDPFNQPKVNLFSERFLEEAYAISICSNCTVIIPEEDEVLNNAITLEFCHKNNITPIISKGDDHRLGKYFGSL